MHIYLTRLAGGYSILVECRTRIVTLVFETSTGLRENEIGIHCDQEGSPWNTIRSPSAELQETAGSAEVEMIWRRHGGKAAS